MEITKNEVEWLKDAVSCLKEFQDYAEEMRHIGRGFFPCGMKGHSLEAVISVCESIVKREKAA